MVVAVVGGRSREGMAKRARFEHHDASIAGVQQGTKTHAYARTHARTHTHPLSLGSHQIRRPEIDVVLGVVDPQQVMFGPLRFG